MKLSIFFLCLLWLVVAIDTGVQATCSAPIKARVIGQLSRNASGHWLANASLSQMSHAAQAPALQVELLPSIMRCSGVRTHTFTLTVAGNPLPPGPGYKATASRWSYYKVHEENMDWEQAKTICEAENAHLLILNSKQEADEIKELLKSYPKIEWVHLGISDKAKEGEWVTIFGQSVYETNFNEWDKGEPSSSKDEHCGHLFISSMMMHDWLCKEGQHPFICEQVL